MSTYDNNFDDFDMQDARERESLESDIRELSNVNWDEFLFDAESEEDEDFE